MDDKSFNIRVSKKWVRMGMVALVTAMIVAPVTAFAAHQFTDVPNSNTFHDDIAWLADAGVTKGCNPPANTEFCPDDPTTRGQMAAFMKRFAGYIGAEDGTPAQADNASTADYAEDSNKLDGLNSTAFGRSKGVSSNDFDVTGTATLINAGTTTVESLSANAPADGAFVIMYSAAVKTNGVFGSGEILIYGRAAVDGTDIDGSLSSVMLDDDITNFYDQGTVASQVVVPVTAGSHTVDLNVLLQEESTPDNAYVWGSSLVVMWVPQGSFVTSFSGAGSGASATVGE